MLIRYFATVSLGLGLFASNGLAQQAATADAPSSADATPSATSDAEPLTADTPTAEKEPKSINANFINPEMNVTEWVERFEGESREVFTNRAAVFDALQIKPEHRVADVGTGTGFYARLFATQANWVYAVDISPVFIQHNRDVIASQALQNITPVLCGERSIDLPTDSVDLVFVCDTYHHFEYYPETLKSIHRALRPEGRLAIIDFERIPGESREWIMGHVRAGKETVSDEIRAAAFELTREVQIPAFEENYFLIFEKR